MNQDEEHQIAEAVRQACIEAAKQGFMDASIRGLCTDGAVEAAISAMQMLDVGQIADSRKS